MGKKKGSAKEKVVVKEEPTSWSKTIIREYAKLSVPKEAILGKIMDRKDSLSIQEWIDVWRHSPVYLQSKALDVIEERGKELSLADRKRMIAICGRNPALLGQKDRIRDIGLRSAQAA